LPDSVAFIRQIDYRTNPRRWTILPKTVKESGTQITDLPLWGDRVSTDTYLYGDTGNFYKRTSAGSVTLLRSVAGSHGNGLKYFGEDNFMYYARDNTFGRYGRMDATPSFVDDFLTAEGGVPTNTYSIDFESGTSHYGTAADSASLSITGDLAIEVNFKPESLPTAGNEMVLLAKWDKNSDERAYKFSVYAVSGAFGDGTDGALTISSNTTEAPIDSACTGTSATTSLSATNASFAAGQVILIHQSRGTGAGTWMRNKISSYTAGTITLETALNYTYVSGEQVRVLKQHTTVTVNSAITYTAKAWNGTVGGILGFLASTSTTATGSISATGKGFRGGAGAATTSTQTATQGEGTAGAGALGTTANGNGGGGSDDSAYNDGGYWGGGGGGNGTAGSVGSGSGGSSTTGAAGATAGSADLTTAVFGGGGGGIAIAINSDSVSQVGNGGAGGGLVIIYSTAITVTGSIVSNGSAGIQHSTTGSGILGSGGSGAGGSVLIKAQTATLGTALITATGAATGGGGQGSGGAGGNGRIHLDYYTSYTGTTSPTLDVVQDNTLVANTTYQLRLALSSNGTTEEFLTKNLTSIVAGSWGHYATSWDASASTATFWENGVSLGTSVGAFTSLTNTTALLTLGASLNASSAAESFADGKFDDVRLWNTERTTAQIFNNKEVELVGTESGLVAYYQLDNSASDTTANANNLTMQNSPAYSTDVAFSSPTTRLDIDQQDTSTGDTYALGTTIDEGASHRQTFVPTKDPQKSIGIYISDTGDSCDWTVIVHDALNRTIASKTLTHAQVNTGHMEFIFDDVWTPVIGASYHFHVYASNTTGTPLTVAGTSNNLETTQYKSYYQFLIEDIYHPIEQTLNFLSIGNGRYVATWDATTYDPHRLTFPAGWRVRCIGKWREYFAFGCWRGTSITDHDIGIIFFWDGISSTYNFFIEVPEGAINAMFGAQGTLSFIAGYQGDLLEFLGGDRASKVKRLPKITPDKYIEVLPGALTMWRTLLHIGAGVTNSSDFEQSVYSYGSINRNYPDSLSSDYIISTGVTQSSDVKIGLVMPVATKLLIGWKSNLSYGLDSVDPAGDPYAQGSIEWLIRDEGGIWKEKMPNVIRADYETLISGHSIGLQYKLDRNTDWSTETLQEYDSDPEGRENEYLRVQPNITDENDEVRHREYQVRLNLKTSAASSPAALGVTILEDLLTDEDFV